MEAASARPQAAGEPDWRHVGRGRKQGGRQTHGQEPEEETRWGDVAECRDGTWGLAIGRHKFPATQAGLGDSDQIPPCSRPPSHQSDERVPPWIGRPVRSSGSDILASRSAVSGDLGLTDVAQNAEMAEQNSAEGHCPSPFPTGPGSPAVIG